jgi:hypothetical protein
MRRSVNAGARGPSRVVEHPGVFPFPFLSWGAHLLTHLHSGTDTAAAAIPPPVQSMSSLAAGDHMAGDAKLTLALSCCDWSISTASMPELVVTPVVSGGRVIPGTVVLKAAMEGKECCGARDDVSQRLRDTVSTSLGRVGLWAYTRRRATGHTLRPGVESAATRLPEDLAS